MECNYREYCMNLRFEMGRVEIVEQPVYHRRVFGLSERRTKLFEQGFIDALSDPSLSKSERAILSSFKNTYHSQMQNEREYKALYGSVSYDELAYLELAGVATYSKEYCYLVDLSSSIDILLAFFAGDNVLTVRDGIEKVCESSGISYKLFSRALTTCEKDLQKFIRMEMIYAVSPKVRDACKKILLSRNQLAGNPRFKDINLHLLSDLELIQTVLTSQILFDMQYILVCVMNQYKAQQGKNPDCMLISKGLTHILIESDNPNKELSYKVDLGSVGCLEIQPVRYQRHMIHEVLLGHPIRRVQVV